MGQNIGKFDRRIGLESYTETRSETSGGVSTSYTPLGQKWAKVTYDNGTENPPGDQKVAVQRITFRIRFVTGGLTTRFRVTYQGKAFDILSVTEVGRREALDLVAENIT